MIFDSSPYIPFVYGALGGLAYGLVSFITEIETARNKFLDKKYIDDLKNNFWFFYFLPLIGTIFLGGIWTYLLSISIMVPALQFFIGLITTGFIKNVVPKTQTQKEIFKV